MNTTCTEQYPAGRPPTYCADLSRSTCRPGSAFFDIGFLFKFSQTLPLGTINRFSSELITGRQIQLKKGISNNNESFKKKFNLVDFIDYYLWVGSKSTG
jgi:hypothetical protein